MKPTVLTKYATFFVIGFVAPMGLVHAQFSSGSTGADGPLVVAQSANVTLQVPPDGKFNYTTITINSFATVRFIRNARNTPVYMLATGNVIINGTIDVGGEDAGAGGDFTLQGRGGPGGGDGGRGGPTPSVAGGDGLGPGGGHGGIENGAQAIGGGGGGYQSVGANAQSWTSGVPGSGGSTYGTAWVQPLAGGSGGGGGAGSASTGGTGGGGGGGGGGAILIASSGTISGNGLVLAQGGIGQRGATNAGAPRCDGTGGGGSGGAIRLLATAITFPTGRAFVTGGNTNGAVCAGSGGGIGGSGFTRFEVLFGGTLDISLIPTLSITRVAGIDAPANLTGYGDITIPVGTPNPVSVELRATGIPPGGTVTVTVSPSSGPSVSVTSTILVGTQASSTASAQISVPNGLSSVQASANYAVPLALVEPLTRFAGESVKNLKLASVLNGGAAKTFAVTASGRELEVPPALLSQIALLTH